MSIIEKTSLDQERFDAIKKSILENVDNKEELRLLDEKLKEVINPETNKNYEIMTKPLKDSTIDSITGFMIGYSDDMKQTIKDQVIKQLTNDVFNDEEIKQLIENDLRSYYQEHYIYQPPNIPILNATNDKIPTSESEAAYIARCTKMVQNDIIIRSEQAIERNIDEHVRKESYRIIKNIRNNIYSKSNKTGISKDTANLIAGIAQDFSYATEDIVHDVLQSGSFSSTTLQKVEQCFQKRYDTYQTKVFKNIENIGNNKMEGLVNKINKKIGNVFCAPRMRIDKNGNVTFDINSGGINLNNLKIGGKTLGQHMDKVNNALSKAQKIADTLTGLGGLGMGLGGGIGLPSTHTSMLGVGLESQQESIEFKQEVFRIAKKKKEKKEEEKKENPPKEKKEKPEVAKKQADPTNSDPPKEETYDNSIPPRATVNSDPRRESQELVLWEGKEKYVLLRDGAGNYLLLDEDKGCVRLQNKNGSYIQLASNGNIEIEAANHVRLNCSGASYIKQF